MGKPDFFISYTKTDHDWAEWIAWQLEDAGYKCHIQAWDFTSSSNWVQKMDQGTYAERTLLVYSPDYFQATYVIPEWQAAFARDPTGEKGKILGVKVQECRPDGLLRPVVWISLIGLEEQEAKSTLLEAAHGQRLKPLIAPSFPGAAQHSSRQEPYFPGATSPKVNSSAMNQTSFLVNNPTLTLAANERVQNAFKQRPSQLPSRAWMQVVWTPIQTEEVLDPNQFIDPLFTRKVIQLARQDDLALFDDLSRVIKNSDISNLTLIQHQGERLEENQTHLVLYSNGTVSIAFTNLYQFRKPQSSFSKWYIDKNVVEMRLREASSFVARWYDYQDPHLKYDPLIYNLYFYNLDLHRWGETPSSQVYTFQVSHQGGPKSLAIYNPPKELTRSKLQNPNDLINHAITRAEIVFNQR